MIDQAQNLRNRVKDKKIESASVDNYKKQSRIITVTSGKGGVGKTNFTLNLAINLSLKGLRVVVIDTDFGLANVEVLFGNIPKYNFSHLISGEKRIDEILIDGPNGIKFISGGSGISQLANISKEQIANIIDDFKYIDKIADIILIDTGAGIYKTIINFVLSSEECIIVTTPEPTSITDAYAILKTLGEEKQEMPKFYVVINRVDDDFEGDEIFQRLSKVSSKFLGINIEFLGNIPFDKMLIKAVKIQEPVAIAFPSSESNLAIQKISYRLLGIINDKFNQQGGMKKFIKKIFNVLNN
jgi:flagellar biosynthesis protein FlhG